MNTGELRRLAEGVLDCLDAGDVRGARNYASAIATPYGVAAFAIGALLAAFFAPSPENIIPSILTGVAWGIGGLFAIIAGCIVLAIAWYLLRDLWFLWLAIGLAVVGYYFFGRWGGAIGIAGGGLLCLLDAHLRDRREAKISRKPTTLDHDYHQ